MLKLLRKIEAPREFSLGGNWISASLLDQVSDYQSLIKTAQKHIKEMEISARAELEQQRNAVLRDVADDCRGDVVRITEAFQKRIKILETQMASSCIEVTRIAIEQLTNSIPEKQRAQLLIQSLLERVKSRSSLIIKANPLQAELIEKLIAADLADKFGLINWSVKAEPSVKRDRFVIDADGNSYMDVSLENWLALMMQEIESIRTYFEFSPNSDQGQS